MRPKQWFFIFSLYLSNSIVTIRQNLSLPLSRLKFCCFLPWLFLLFLFCRLFSDKSVLNQRGKKIIWFPICLKIVTLVLVVVARLSNCINLCVCVSGFCLILFPLHLFYQLPLIVGSRALLLTTMPSRQICLLTFPFPFALSLSLFLCSSFF